MGNNICQLRPNEICLTTHCSNYVSHFNITLCDEISYVDCNLKKQIISNNCNLGSISLLLIFIILIGVVGNVCVCAVIWKQPSLRTPTNCYLFSLAISDLFILLDLPHTIYFLWHIYPDTLGIVVCRLRLATAEIGTYTSVLTVVAFSIERYIAVCHPFRTASCVDPLKRTVIIISGIWVVSLACSVPLTQDYALIRHIEYPPESGKFSELSTICVNEQKHLSTFLKVTSVLFFFIPMAILIVMYSRVAICLWKRKKLLKSSQLHGQLHSDRVSGHERATVSVLATVVIAFFICWLPLHIQRLISLADIVDGENKDMLLIFAFVLKYFSAAINPILYNVMSQTYRRAFKEVIIKSSSKYRRDPNIVRMSTLTKTTSVNSERNT